MFGARRTAFDVDIDMLEEKPWRKPGIDIADYFNYGFDERGWRVRTSSVYDMLLECGDLGIRSETAQDST